MIGGDIMYRQRVFPGVHPLNVRGYARRGGVRL